MFRLEDYVEDARGCPRCSNCKFIEHIWVKSARFARQCPINVRYKFNLYSAPGLLHSALGVLSNELEFSPKLMDALYKCTLCGACDIRCKRNLDLEILAVIETLKARSVEMGKGPAPEHKAVAEKIKKSNNRYGSPHGNRLKWITDDIKIATKGKMLYFVGCRSSYVHTKIARATAKMLNNSSTDFVVSEEESCCGYPLYSTGQFDAFQKQMEHNIEMVKKSGAKIVIMNCAECYKTWKVDYPKFLSKSTDDMEFKVLHIAEYLEELVKSGNLKLENRVNIKATYHDPCNLGRLSEPWYHWEGVHKHFGVLEPPKTWRRGDKGIYEQPRDILKRIPGIEFVEMERARDNSWCCGAGAEVQDTFKDFALWTASERLEEAKAAGAEAIISCCPACEELLSEAVNASKDGMKVYDMVEIVLQAVSPKNDSGA